MGTVHRLGCLDPARSPVIPKTSPKGEDMVSKCGGAACSCWSGLKVFSGQWTESSWVPRTTVASYTGPGALSPSARIAILKQFSLQPVTISVLFPGSRVPHFNNLHGYLILIIGSDTWLLLAVGLPS